MSVKRMKRPFPLLVKYHTTDKSPSKEIITNASLQRISIEFQKMVDIRQYDPNAQFIETAS